MATAVATAMATATATAMAMAMNMAMAMAVVIAMAMAMVMGISVSTFRSTPMTDMIDVFLKREVLIGVNSSKIISREAHQVVIKDGMVWVVEDVRQRALTGIPLDNIDHLRKYEREGDD